MPDYNTTSPAGMELAQLTEMVSCHRTVNQNAAVQMQIQSVHEQIMLKNIPITKDFYHHFIENTLTWVPPKSFAH